MPMFMVLFYFITTVASVMVALSLVGALVWLVEFVQDKLAERRKK